MGDDEQAFLDDLAVFLRREDIQRLVKAHPNQVARDLPALDDWRSWWDWAGQSEDGEPRWSFLWRFYAAENPDNNDFASIPVDLRHHVNEARRLQLSRKQGFEAKAPTSGGGYKMLPGGLHGPETMLGFQDTQEQKARPGEEKTPTDREAQDIFQFPDTLATSGGGYKMPPGGFHSSGTMSGFQDTQEQEARPGGSTGGRGMSSFAVTMLSSESAPSGGGYKIPPGGFRGPETMSGSQDTQEQKARPGGSTREPWWERAGQSEDLSRFYAAENPDNNEFASIPADLQHHVHEAWRLQLPREFEAKTPTDREAQDIFQFPDTLATSGGGPETMSGSQDTQEQKVRPGGSTRGRGMSPKKLHEVESMSSFAATMLSSLAKRGTSIQHAVDVGAGQAYLSRALRDELGLHVLAVDWSAVQEQGAARREERKKCTHGPGSRVGSLTYRNVAITSDSLQSATDEWIRNAEQKPAPLLLVALHACGSLTLDILRTLLRRLKTPDSSWSPHAALIVGCCYNLLRPEDCTDQNGYGLALSANHLQLAAQVPSQWGLSPAARKDAELAIRKVSWRAMLDRALDPSVCERRLGRVNDSAYRDWETFTSVAQEKLGVDTLTVPRDTRLESQLGVLHFLRCILGPVIESFLLLDRKLWVQRELEGSGLSVHLVNLFDQASGSARNVSIVVAPE